MKKPTITKEEQEAREREEDRIAGQRNLFTFLPVVPAVELLKEGMLQRAYDLLTDGDAEACDAILEFLPSTDARRMLDAWARGYAGWGQVGTFKHVLSQVLHPCRPRGQEQEGHASVSPSEASTSK